ncbi:MAG: thiol-disulfide oxidoreductase [Crocinitomicaceae bacterium]|nr:thiol-disulfide oxidoreductase [Crocinitomicaceae bacterium]|tara:strand:+ start:159 stop:572 length:414 start_codon:yes stop_codon:yes gene_type:complete
MNASAPYPVVLFDGYCNLCNGSVQEIIKRDPKGIFKLASLQSDIGIQLLKNSNINTDKVDSIVLVDHDGIYIKSTAALKIAARLAFPYFLLNVFSVIPKALRDLIYDWIARNRYKWFGKKNECWIPDERLKNRFIDQ